eukprot:5840102-Ditylum_brightwellii.AAC.1
MPSWKQYYLCLPTNNKGDKWMGEFSHAMGSSRSLEARLRNIIESPKLRFLAASEDKTISIFHSALNFGGTITTLAHKVVILMGLSKKAVSVKLNVASALATVEIATPTLDELEICQTQEAVALVPTPAATAAVTFMGSAIFLPAPWLREALFESGEDNPFTLIPLALLSATLFDATHSNTDATYPGKAMDQANDFILWAWCVGTGQVPETCYSVIPDNGEL